jgi:hypothetical protein
MQNTDHGLPTSSVILLRNAFSVPKLLGILYHTKPNTVKFITHNSKRKSAMTQNQAQTKNQIAQLRVKIARARKRLHALWDERGCTDYDVLTVAAILD